MVANALEVVLQAIDDRVITHLLVPGSQPGSLSFKSATLASACLRSALAYAPDADLTAVGNAVSKSYVSALIDVSAAFDPQTNAAR